jgi:hypothetical protein
MDLATDLLLLMTLEILEVNIVNSTFLTGSFDETVLYWDLRSDRAIVSILCL